MSRRLRDIASSRSGDKGNVVNICVIPYEDSDWELLCQVLTPELVAQRFVDLTDGRIEVQRYELHGIRALNFVIGGALAGGVSTSLRIDGHGKTFQSLILDMEI